MNNDEIKSLIVKVLLMIFTSVATAMHINASAGDLTPFAADIADMIVLGYGVYLHWNMKKVPETAIVTGAFGGPK